MSTIFGNTKQEAVEITQLGFFFSPAYSAESFFEGSDGQLPAYSDTIMSWLLLPQRTHS